MTPWNIIGWALLGLFAIWAILSIVMLADTFIRLALDKRKHRRAHAGKVRCEDPDPCYAMAVRQTPNGYFCDAHWLDHVSKGPRYRSISYSHALEWTKKDLES